MHVSTCAAHGRDEAADQSEKVGSPGDAGLGEDVIAMRSRGCLGNAEGGCGFGEACPGHECCNRRASAGVRLKIRATVPKSAGDAALGVTNTAAAVCPSDRGP